MVLQVSKYSVCIPSATKAMQHQREGVFLLYVQTSSCRLTVLEATSREALVREKVREVVTCDINSSTIIAEGFEGPYDVVLRLPVWNVHVRREKRLLRT